MYSVILKRYKSGKVVPVIINEARWREDIWGSGVVAPNFLTSALV
jgi:hypothetical protein